MTGVTGDPGMHLLPESFISGYSVFPGSTAMVHCLLNSDQGTCACS